MICEIPCKNCHLHTLTYFGLCFYTFLRQQSAEKNKVNYDFAKCGSSGVKLRYTVNTTTLFVFFCAEDPSKACGNGFVHCKTQGRTRIWGEAGCSTMVKPFCDMLCRKNSACFLLACQSEPVKWKLGSWWRCHGCRPAPPPTARPQEKPGRRKPNISKPVRT